MMIAPSQRPDLHLRLQHIYHDIELAIYQHNEPDQPPGVLTDRIAALGALSERLKNKTEIQNEGFQKALSAAILQHTGNGKSHTSAAEATITIIETFRRAHFKTTHEGLLLCIQGAPAAVFDAYLNHYIADGCNLNTLDKHGQNALFNLARTHRNEVKYGRKHPTCIEKLQQLTGHPINLDQQDYTLQWSPMHYSLSMGLFDFSLRLAQLGAQSQLKDHLGMTPVEAYLDSKDLAHFRGTHQNEFLAFHGALEALELSRSVQHAKPVPSAQGVRL